jgi:hypothetical protein
LLPGLHFTQNGFFPVTSAQRQYKAKIRVNKCASVWPTTSHLSISSRFIYCRQKSVEQTTYSYHWGLGIPHCTEAFPSISLHYMHQNQRHIINTDFSDMCVLTYFARFFISILIFKFKFHINLKRKRINIEFP